MSERIDIQELRRLEYNLSRIRDSLLGAGVSDEIRARDRYLSQADMFAKETEDDIRRLLQALTAAEARAEAAEERVRYLQIIIDCVVANCEASASSYQERIETIHRVTSALALEWAEDRTLKGAPQ